MSNYTFTAEDVVAEVRKIAAEMPDFVYTDQGADLGPGEFTAPCSYLGRSVGDEQGQACIVGTALQRLGVSRDDLLEQEGNCALDAVRLLLSPTEPRLPVRYWLAHVQQAQDTGFSWGDAVRMADGEVVRRPEDEGLEDDDDE